MIINYCFDNIGSSLIQAGSSLLNGVLGWFSNKSTNKSNLQIARETNQANKEINQSQLDYNWDMWHAQNNYNRPSEQRQRLIDAGLNPIYYGLDGNSAGSAPAFNPIGAQQSSPMQAYDFNALSDIGLKLAQIENLQADSDNKQGQSELARVRSETERQLRTGQLVIQGQQIQLNIDQHQLNVSNNNKLVNETLAIQQSVDESSARIDNIRSEITNREFDQKIRSAYYQLDDLYKKGMLSLQEQQLAVSWFDAQTNRQNASTNYFNSQTNRMGTVNSIEDSRATRFNRNQLFRSLSAFNDVQSSYITDKNVREQKAFTLEQISRAANAYKSCVEAFFSPAKNQMDLVNSASSAISPFK